MIARTESDEDVRVDSGRWSEFESNGKDKDRAEMRRACVCEYVHENMNRLLMMYIYICVL